MQEHDWQKIAPEVAKQILGEPSIQKSNEWRWGNKGSLTFNLETAQFYDFEEGVGGGVKDGLSGCKGFVNGSKALKSENFQNLKTQCFFKLAEMVNTGKIAIKDTSHKQAIIEELEIIKRDKIDKDTQKLAIIPKDTIKSLLGRSPDYADALMMRMWYEVKGNYGVCAF